MKKVAAKLAKLLGYEHVVFFGRARSALVALIEETVSTRAPIIIPSNACTALLAAIVATGRTPVLASVSSESGLVPDAALAAMIDRWTDEPGLVLVTHLYGMIAAHAATAAAARRCGWQLFENDSLASMAFVPEHRTLGRGRLVSFGVGKTLDGGGGGAFLTNDPNLAASLAERSATWPVFNPVAEAIEDHVVLARRHLTALGVAKGSEILLPIEAGQCRHAFDDTLCDTLEGAIAAFPAANERKLERLAAWHAALASVDTVLTPSPAPVGAAWRAVFKALNETLRDQFVRRLREAGFDVGTNYPPLWNSAPALVGHHRASGGDLWGATVLTLWLSEAYDDERIRAGADIIERAVRENG